MNILFVNYGDFTTNSLNHIGGFANTLCAAGHTCAVAVPHRKETLQHIANPLFIAVTFEEALARPNLFPDGRTAEVIHAWTPREGVRKFTLAYQAAAQALAGQAGGSVGKDAAARLIIHLEDNEHFLLESFTGLTLEQLRDASAADLESRLNDSLPHPLHSEGFLRIADAVTHIIPKLADFAPPGTPTHLLLPGVDFALYRPALLEPSAVAAARAELGLRDGEKLIVFTGSNTFANEPEMRELYLAIALLNQRGAPTRLVRTGFNSPHFIEGLADDVKQHVIDLGFVAKARLPQLLALADVLVQPGRPGPFNDYRLPSKLPEFLAIGKPVVLPPTNLAAFLTEGREAIFLPATGTPTDIADTCELLFGDPALCGTLAENSAAFARLHFDLAANTAKLLAFYETTLTQPAAVDWQLARHDSADEVALLADKLRRAAGSLPTKPFASEIDLLGRLAGERYDRADCKRARRIREIEAEQTLTRQHVANLETLLAAARENVGALEQAREKREALTQQHIANLTAERDSLLAREKLTQQHLANLESAQASAHTDIAALTAERENLITREKLTQQHVTNIEAERVNALVREQLTQRHAATLETLLAAARDNIAGLEKAREMTQVFLENQGRELEKHKQHREKADVLLRSAREQVVAYENALLGADAEIVALKDEIEQTQQALATSRAEMAAGLQALEQTRAAAAHSEAQLRAAHAAELAAAADRLARAEAVVRSREEKIATMQSSFSWKVTSPLRALRRQFFDQPAPPRVDPNLLGNVDYPHDWTNIAPTLNVRGWSLHRDRVPLKAIRARLGGQPASVEFGLERLDVLDHFRDYPGAESSGWIVKADVPRRGTHLLIIEVQDASDQWHIAVARHVKRSAKAAPPPPNTYAAWVAAHDTLTPDSADQYRAKLASLTRRPLISVVMPVYNTPEKLLVAAIESVRNQLYENWELCIADDASKEPHVQKILQRYQQKDSKRIKVVFRETNGHICAASNSALALAHGEFVALLDHDDVLRPHALACVALELEAHPDADLIYSDEDKIDENGYRYDPYFKPDWNPDLFNVQNCISHLGVYRTLLMRDVGGFRVGYHGSQDWDLAMRVIERTAPDRIRHIPKILYHWRSVPGSTAMLIGAKDYAKDSAEKVISEHFGRIGVNVSISPTKGSYWRVHYPIPEPAPRVTLIIPTRNRLNVLRPCVESLLAKTTYPNFEVLIVDNDSDDPETLAYLRQLEAGAGGEGRKQNGAASHGAVRVVRFPGEFNFSAINNFGVEQTDAPLVGLLNNDLEVIHGDWLDEMVSHALRPEIGCVGAKLYYPDDRIQHAGVILGIGGVAAHAWQTHPRGAAGQAHRNLLQQNLSAVTAACLVIRRETFLQVGGLNAAELKVAFNDVDFCLKVRAAGFRNLWTPYAELYHHESASRGKEDTLEKRDRFRSEVEYMRATWGELLDNDPAYNPNLTLTINDFTLAVPPREWPPLK